MGKTSAGAERGGLLCRRQPWPLQRPHLVRLLLKTWSSQEGEEEEEGGGDDERKKREAMNVVVVCGD